MISDLSKYKRLFTFGCSLTRYKYPTWADVLSKEMPNSEFYNLGYAGTGNKFISYYIAQANNRFKFSKDDLVLVMYTSSCREDRYVKGNWKAHGNVYNNPYYDEDYLMKYSDVNGYHYESMALMELSMKYIKSLPCSSEFLLGYPLPHNEAPYPVDEEFFMKISDLFSDVRFPISYLKFLGKDFISKGFKFIDDKGNIQYDAHPLPINGYEYLHFLGFPLTEKSYLYAVEETNNCNKFTTVDDVEKYYKEYFWSLHSNTRDMI